MQYKKVINKYRTDKAFVGKSSSFLLLLLALPLLAGWITINESSIFMPWIGMQFNTALGIVLMSIIILAKTLKKHVVAQITSIFLFILGGLTLFQHISGYDFFIDELFRKSVRAVYENYPGRMALDSSMTFFLLSISFFITSSKNLNGAKYFYSSFLSALCVAIGIAALVGKILGLESTIDSASFSYMSMATALSISIASIWLYIDNLRKVSISDERHRAVPMIIVLLLTVVVVQLWQFSIKQEVGFLKSSLTSKINRMSEEITEGLHQTANALERYGARVNLLGITNQEYLNLDSENYLKQLRFLTEISITDKNLKVVWSYPSDSVFKSKKSTSTDFIKKLKTAVEVSKASKLPTLSQTIEFKKDTFGNILPIPLYDNNTFVRNIYGVIKVDKLFGGLFDNKDFSVTVTEGEGVVYYKKADTSVLNNLSINVPISWGLTNWKLSVTPTLIYSQTNTSKKHYFILIIGEIITLLCGLLLLSFFKAQREKQMFFQKETDVLIRMNVALESAKIAAISIDLTNGEVWRSKDHDLIFGYSTPLAEWSQDTLYSHIIDEDIERVRESQVAAINTKKSYQIDFRIKRADSHSLRWIKIVTQTIFDKDDNPTRQVGTIQDITEEKQKDLEHHLDAEWRKAILNSADYSIISTDVEGTIQTFNRAAEKMLGYKASEMIDKASPAILHDLGEVVSRSESLSKELGFTVTPGFDTFIAKSKISGKPDENEWTYIRKDGSRLSISLSVNTLKDQRGEIYGYLGIAIDLTEKKKADEALKITHDRLQRVIEATGEGMWERDYQTNEIQYIDLQGKQIFGFQPDENPTYDAVMSLIHPADKHHIAQAIKEHELNRNPRFEAEFRIYDKTNTEKWIKTRGQVSTKSNGRTQVLATFSDVTQEVEARIQLEKALLEAEAATKAKAIFLASMSHEIRTPLNGILGMTDMLLETDLNSEQINFAKIVQLSGAALLSLINDILDFSKVEAGKMEIENSNLNIAHVVENQIDILSAKAKEKNITLASFISPALPEQFVGDAGRIGQILLNLIGNAVKFTSQGGVSVSVNAQGSDRLRFEISDTGIGMQPEDQKKIFKPFTQANLAVSSKFGGTGLGLSICKKLIDAMGGKIGLESEYGKGSTFWFEIPLIKANTSQTEDHRVSWEKLINVRTLLIEEDAISRKSIHDYIISSKMRNGSVATAEDASKILRKAIEDKDPYSIVLISSQNGKVNGRKIYTQLKKEFKEKMPKAIYINDFGKKIPEGDYIKYGFSAIIHKPVKQSLLFNTLVSALTGIESDQASNRNNTTKKVEELRSKYRILVADDVAVNQLLTRTMLDFLGYNCTTVANGLEVLDALKQSEYDLILMDCQMPEMDGFEATQKIRENENINIQKIPIIALTANAMDGDAKKCIDSGMDDYLSKPMKKEQLAEKLDKWLILAATKKAS